MNLKEILNQVLSECGFAESPQFFAAQNSDVKQLIALAQRSARVLSKHNWQSLRSSHEVTLTTDTSYSLPTDFRQFIPDTTFAEGRADKPNFPPSNEAWAYTESRNINNSLRYRIRIAEGALQVQNPVVGEVIRFEYVSNYPVLDVLATPKARFTRDSDTWRLDDDLIQMDLVWRFKKLKGLDDWQIDFQDFNNYSRKLLGTDNNAQSINTVGPSEVAFEPVADLWIQ